MISVVVTICGAMVMCLEMMAFRVLTPSFGGDVYVSGSIIGVFLAALSLGYYSGGRVADRWPGRPLLGGIIFVAGLCAVVIPTLKDPLLVWSEGWVADRRWGACLYTLLLFGPSTILLAMVSPFAIRLSSRQIGEMGQVSGRLYALSTFGSIFGTLFTSFYWISWWPVSQITRATGLILCALGALLAAAPLLSARRAALVLAGWSLVSLPSVAVAAERVVYQRDTMYHRVVVTEDGRWRSLKFNRTEQSGMAIKDPLRSEFRYTDALHLAMVYQPPGALANLGSQLPAPSTEHRAPSTKGGPRVLFVGLGGAVGPKQFQKWYPDVAIDVAEIDPVVVEVAKHYFDFEPGARTRVSAADGRVYLNGSRDTYDAIIVDAYYADAIPFHLTTVEFMRLLRRRLAPGGVALFNVIGSLEGRASKLVRSEFKTIRRVFPHCAVFPVPDSFESPTDVSRERIRNVILVATSTASLDAREVVRRAAKLKNPRLPYLGAIAAAYDGAELQTGDVPLLTDDFAPVDNLIPIP